jgi:hypothetical protein
MLEGWTREIRRRAETFVEPDGTPTPAAFALVGNAMELLGSCGRAALAQEYEGTVQSLTNACCMSVSNAYSINPSSARRHLLNRAWNSQGSH